MTRREQLEKWCGEPLEQFAERLEHAARMTWRQARVDPHHREQNLGASRGLSIAAAEFREAAK